MTLSLSVNFKINVTNFLYRTVVRKRQKDLYNIQCHDIEKEKKKKERCLAVFLGLYSSMETLDWNIKALVLSSFRQIKPNTPLFEYD